MNPLAYRSLISTVIAILLFIINDGTEGKVFTKCEAARALESGGISRTWTGNWVCLMQSTSGMDSRLITGPGLASSYSYGIFQINSNQWCARGRKGGRCNARCESFADDNIQDDIICARKIFDSMGFGGWNGWVKKCKNKPLPIVTNC